MVKGHTCFTKKKKKIACSSLQFSLLYTFYPVVMKENFKKSLNYSPEVGCILCGCREPSAGKRSLTCRQLIREPTFWLGCLISIPLITETSSNSPHDTHDRFLIKLSPQKPLLYWTSHNKSTLYWTNIPVYRELNIHDDSWGN